MAITIEEAIKKLLITGLYPCGPKREQGLFECYFRILLF